MAGTTGFLVALALTVWSAAYLKHTTVTTPLTVVSPLGGPGGPSPISEEDLADLERVISDPGSTEPPLESARRWFDGRPVRPVRTIWMTVTAYSPDARSCGRWADGRTATMHSVWTNGMRLVAADTSVLPFRSMVSVPGYSDGEIVPVLDRGGAIKGLRLDVLMPTHEIARRWGVRRLPVTVWGWAEESLDEVEDPTSTARP